VSVILSRPTKRASKPPLSWGRLGEGIGTLFTLTFVLLPIVWLLLTAFKTQRDAYTTRVFFTPTLENFRVIFQEMNAGHTLTNSLLISTTTILIAIPVAAMAAYVFSRFVFRGSDLLLVWVLTTQFLPPVVILLPFYALFRAPFGWLPEAWRSLPAVDQLAHVSLIDTHLALIILNLSIVLPYAIWLIKGFVDALPTELEEAAMVDGCTDLQILRHITAPLIMPGVIVAAVFGFIMAWNEFLFALVITSQQAQTLQITLHATNAARGIMWEQMSAVGALIIFPILIMSLTIRNYFVEGLTMGAVK